MCRPLDSLRRDTLSQILFRVALPARGVCQQFCGWMWVACACSALKPLCHGSNQQKGSRAKIMSCQYLQFRKFFPVSPSNSLLDDSVFLLFPPQNAPVAFLRYDTVILLWLSALGNLEWSPTASCSFSGGGSSL